MKTHARLLAVGSILMGVLCATAADAKLADASSAQVSFTAVGPAGLRIEGKGSELSVAEDASAVTVVVPLANFKTGIDLRDKHFREYLEVAKFPAAELSVARSALKVPAGDGAVSGQAEGTLKLHGQTKRIVVRYEAKRSGSTIDVAGDAQLDIRDFGIRVPSYLGVTVKPDVAIAVKFAVRER